MVLVIYIECDIFVLPICSDLDYICWKLMSQTIFLVFYISENCRNIYSMPEDGFRSNLLCIIVFNKIILYNLSNTTL